MRNGEILRWENIHTYYSTEEKFLESTPMPADRILVIDDEEDILELVRYNLEREGYHVTCVASGEEALKTVKKDKPDLIVLDIMLPDVNGLEITKVLKKDASTGGIPIIMLSARGEEADVVAGLELGADDYIVKPFSPRILTARVKAVLRRRYYAEGDEGSVIRINDLALDLNQHEVTVRNEKVSLTATQYQILLILARRPGWVFTRGQILDAVHGLDYAVEERAVDVQIVGLRRKLGPCGAYIKTVPGVGYRLKEE